MTDNKSRKSALSVMKGIDQPPSINPEILNGRSIKKRKNYSVSEYFSGILSGNRAVLSQAITLVESSLPKHYEMAQTIIEKTLPYSGASVRIGITGVPGVGKSTFIEAMGLHLAESGRRVAVLAIDPSSIQSRGSIMGDKTRMEKLSIHPNAYIRPSPSAGSLGGVARMTRETIILCEAAGFDTVLVETVGVGQSEIVAHSMVDFFLLLMLAGAGDELQGIKRGIMEMADAVAITKADGPNRAEAESARLIYNNALRLFPDSPSGWKPGVFTCSALHNEGIRELWEQIMDYVEYTVKNGYFDRRRKEQAIIRMDDMIMDYLKTSFAKNAKVNAIKPQVEKLLGEGKITSYQAAHSLISNYLKDS
ncbi:MAG TPA: methylmalonyl Co-A mutase-associated GTPase MeaB [Bacteroidales bacterium]|nr:methylmalonyl Co-A mutase-associated GTPase MeaB [Bacteroidales bacterium]